MRWEWRFRVGLINSVCLDRTAGIGASASLLDAPAKVASPKISGRSALAAEPSLHAPQRTLPQGQGTGLVGWN